MHQNFFIQHYLYLDLEICLVEDEPEKEKVQRFYNVVDQKPLPCIAFTSVAAFEGLFTAHYIFSLLKKKKLFPVSTLLFKPQSTILMLETQRKVRESRTWEHDYCERIKELQVHKGQCAITKTVWRCSFVSFVKRTTTIVLFFVNI